jgi:hypothetical protein
MRYEDLRDQIRTGDLLGYHGTGCFSWVIEKLTGNHDPQSWSHVGVFYWNGPGLWIAQEYEGVGFGCYPASTLIGKFLKERGDCYLGQAPDFITEKSAGVLDLIATYRATPRLRPYGYGSLVRVLLEDAVSPLSVQAVCSTFVQQAWERCGYTFSHLFTPEDFKRVVRNINPIV